MRRKIIVTSKVFATLNGIYGKTFSPIWIPIAEAFAIVIE